MCLLVDLGPGPGPRRGPGPGSGPGPGPGPGPVPGLGPGHFFWKTMKFDLKWVHMVRYGLILTLDGAL